MQYGNVYKELPPLEDIEKVKRKLNKKIELNSIRLRTTDRTSKTFDKNSL